MNAVDVEAAETWLVPYAGHAQLCYIDPPYMTGQLFRHKDGSVAYDDRWGSVEEYSRYMKHVLYWCWESLADDGSLWVHCDWHCNWILRGLLEDICGSDAFRNEIIWCYTGLSQSVNRCPRKHDTIFFYARPDAKFVVPRRPHRIDNETNPWRRIGIGESMPVIQDPLGAAMESYWTDIQLRPEINRLKLGYPTEKPIKLLDRIVRCSSPEGGLVIDPMCGSGVALEAAKRANRQYAGCDLNPQAVEMANRRLDAVPCVQPTLGAAA